jgi:hypothetical protein
MRLVRVFLNRARGRRELCSRCGRFIGAAWECRCGMKVLARGSLPGRDMDEGAGNGTWVRQVRRCRTRLPCGSFEMPPGAWKSGKSKLALALAAQASREIVVAT